jgi:hypothetical protein
MGIGILDQRGQRGDGFLEFQEADDTDRLHPHGGILILQRLQGRLERVLAAQLLERA